MTTKRTDARWKDGESLAAFVARVRREHPDFGRLVKLLGDAGRTLRPDLVELAQRLLLSRRELLDLRAMCRRAADPERAALAKSWPRLKAGVTEAEAKVAAAAEAADAPGLAPSERERRHEALDDARRELDAATDAAVGPELAFKDFEFLASQGICRMLGGGR